MKSFTTLALLMYCYVFSFAQGTLFGHVLSADETPLPGATIQLLEINRATISDADGFFRFDKIEEGTYQLQIDYLGYSPFVKTIHIQAATERDFTLAQTELEIEEVLIYGNWADEQTPMSFTNFKKEDIETKNLGQDVPYLLRWSPSVVVTSDAGTGIGYTGIRIRGTDPSRINVTINGIPLNDSESQSSFWVDLPDFLSSTESVQIQRGVGSSTNGAAAFGGTINLNTAKLSNTAYATVASSIGSFNTQKYNVSLGSGLLENNLSFDARLSKISSDGYINRASSDLKSYFVSAAYVGDKASLRFNVFSGHEITYQAWNGVPAQYIDDDELRKTNTAGTEKSGEPHDNEVDDYTQTHYQIHYNQELAKNANLNIAFHYTKGLGFFEQYKAAQDLVDYNLTPDAGIETTDLIRRRWLDNDFYGTVFSLNVNPSSKMRATLGGGWNKYLGQHFGEVIWARFMSSGEQGQRYYDNDAQKTDFNIFAKMNYQLSPQLNTYLDLQYRSVDYTFLGFDNDGKNLTQN
ncbi:MAG TPA: TonB-dependent receptor, partial [Saprospiraceae bacterium]|nr:TonB-dependent receptor [Saprospiraceae bacterium]